MSTLYRVLVETTHSVQPTETYWQKEVLYCGPDREQARMAYHRSEPTDYTGGYGNPARLTTLQIIHDAGTDDFGDDGAVPLAD